MTLKQRFVILIVALLVGFLAEKTTVACWWCFLRGLAPVGAVLAVGAALIVLACVLVAIMCLTPERWWPDSDDKSSV
jgi:hypothetical protein